MDIRTIREERRRPAPDGPEILLHGPWQDAWPWLLQGTTTRDRDFALAAGRPTERWGELTRVLGCRAAVHARQPHGAAVGVRTGRAPGLHLVADADGHLTRDPGVMLTVTTADCVPITLVAPPTRTTAPAIGLIHAGWRGAAAGILERGVARMTDAFGVSPGDLHLHLGPSICGACYEVGPEVHEALGLRPSDGPMPVDLPGVLAARAAATGVAPERMSRSAWCTRCSGGELLHSHRAGDAGRQVAFVALGHRTPSGPLAGMSDR